MLSFTDSRSRGVFACFALALFVVCTLAFASTASAAYTVPNFSVTAAPDQAAGHPKLNVSIDPDAAQADTTGGDDLKDITINAPTGLMLNQSAATTKCTDAQLAADNCPAASLVGTIQIKWRTPLGGSITAPGSVYVMTTPSTANTASLGFKLRPTTSHKKLSLRATIANAIPLTAPTRVSVTSIPRTIQPNVGFAVSVTIDQIDIALNAQANATETGPFFTLNPSACTAATTQATFKSWANVSVAKTSAFTPTACASVPFAPTATVTPTVQTPNAATGVSANFAVPTAGQPIQNSAVSAVTANLPTGTKLNSSAINAVSSLCSNSQHAAGSCPSGSKIGTTSVTIPNLSTALAGDIYLMTRSSSSIGFGYVLRNTSLGVRLALKGTASNVDTDGDSVADAVRAVTSGLPQVPWSSAAFNVTSKLVTNPANGCPAATASTRLDGWSGAAAALTNGWFSAPAACTPETSITSGPSGTIASTSAEFAFSSTISGSSFECQLDGAAFSSCASPIQYSGLGQGNHNFCVRAISGGTPDPSPACQTFKVDTIAPTIIVNCQLVGSSTVSCAWSVDEPNVTVTCAVDGVPSNPCPNPVVISGSGVHTIQFTGTDSAGNAGTATRTIVIDPPPPPFVMITSPATNPFYTSASSINVAYTVNGSTVIPAGTTCTAGNASTGNIFASTSTSTNSVSLVAGTNTVIVSCTNASGETGSATVQVLPPPMLQVVITSPANNSNTTAGSTPLSYTVNGATTIPAGAVCTISNLTTGVNQASTSPANNTVTLAMGANNIRVSCSNQFGTGNATVIVNRGLPPVPVITSPISGSTVTVSPVNVSYTVNGAVTIPAGTSCLIANTTNGLSITSTSTSINPIPLQLGANVLTVTCANAFGSATAPTVVNYLHGDRPVITSPTNGSNTSSSVINVTYVFGGTSSLPAGTTCAITNAATGVTTASTSTTTNPVTLLVGSNAITLTCTNAFGSGSTSITVQRGSPPVITVTEPQSSIVVPGTINVAFTVNGGSTIPAGTSCTVNGVATTSATNNPVVIVSGSNTVTVSCTNQFGVETKVLILQTEGLQVVITAPANNSSTNAFQTNVAYTVGGSSTIPAATSCVVTNTTTGVSTPSTSTSINSVALVAGPNSIQASCTNAFGSASGSIIVNRDSLAPTIDGLTSTQGAGGATITYSAADNSGANPTCTPASGTTFPFYFEGHLLVTVTCLDAAGNMNTSSLNVSSNGPEDGLVTEFDGGPNGNTTNPAPTFNYSVYFDTIPTETTGTLPCSTGQTCADVTVPLIEFSCTIDGDPVACGAGSFTSAALPLGIHTFCVSARGIYSGGESAPVCRTFTVISIGSTPPVVTVTSPPFYGGSTGASPMNVAYQVNGSTTIPAGTTCSVNGVPSTNPTTNAAVLSYGTNAIPVTCTNGSGSDTEHVVITRHIGFGVAITTPAPNHTTSRASVNVTYNMWSFGGATGTCTMNGVASTSNSTNNVDLPLGTSSIDLVCLLGNNVSKSSTKVTRGSAPTVAITAPTDNSSAGSTADVSFTVDGSAAIPAGTTCRVNGVASSSTTTNSVALATGANLITVSCSNSFGFNTATITVNGGGGSPDAPVVTISAPIEGTATTAAAVTVNYTVTPADASCDHVSGTNKALSPGANTITVTCTNSAGSGSATVNVTRVGFLSISGSCTTTSATDATCTWSRSGGAAPYVTTCSLDGATAGACTGSSSTTVSFAQAMTTTHTMRVCISDASNQSTCTNLSIAPPGNTGNVVNITSGPGEGSIVTTPTATFTYAATQQTSGTPCPVGQTCVQVIVDITPYYCSFDAGAYQFCGVTTPTFPRFTTPTLVNGVHTFCVKASGVAGIDPQTHNAIPNGVYGPSTCRSFTKTT